MYLMVHCPSMCHIIIQSSAVQYITDRYETFQFSTMKYDSIYCPEGKLVYKAGTKQHISRSQRSKHSLELNYKPLTGGNDDASNL